MQENLTQRMDKSTAPFEEHGKKHDPCMIDVFMSAVHFMETGEALHWYSFTLNRKEKMNQQQKG